MSIDKIRTVSDLKEFIHFIESRGMDKGGELPVYFYNGETVFDVEMHVCEVDCK